MRLPAFICVALLAFAISARGLEPPPTLSSLAGERLEFKVRWGVLPAAKASLEVLDAGNGRLRLKARARTRAYIDAVFPVRDRIESIVLLPGPRVLRFQRDTREGWGDSRHVDVIFDPELGTAKYFRDGEHRKTLLVPPGIQDPLSVFYAYRTLDLPADEDAYLDITDGKKIVTGVVKILGRERVKTPAGSFATVIVEPMIEGIGGVFKKSPGARILIWLTDDAWRRPVKLQSEVIVGAFTAELDEWHHPREFPRDRR